LLLCFAGPSCLDTYTLSLHDALPISSSRCSRPSRSCSAGMDGCSECTCASSDPGPAAACCADEVAQPASSTSAAEKTTVRTTATIGSKRHRPCAPPGGGWHRCGSGVGRGNLLDMLLIASGPIFRHGRGIPPCMPGVHRDLLPCTGSGRDRRRLRQSRGSAVQSAGTRL